jgi:hypothetical protein
MFIIDKDETTGSLKITESFSLGVTSSNPTPLFNAVGDVYIQSFVNLDKVERFKKFTYDLLGGTSTRFLDTFYRISRDGINYSPWLVLSTVINNFPIVDSLDEMFIDVKFVRSGTSQIGTIKLLEYELDGNLLRNVITDQSVVTISTSNPTVIIKPPFIYKVFKITDMEIISTGDISNLSIKYRFSQDYGKTVSNWEPFTKENITTVRINPIRFFQIEYLFEIGTSNSVTQIYDLNLIGDFQNVTLDSMKTNFYGLRENCTCLRFGVENGVTVVSNGAPAYSPLPTLSANDKSKLFNPYNQNQSIALLNKLSNDANTIFGHEVLYFITDPDKKGIDHSFHEYQLYNYVCEDMIKVSVSDNNFPDNQIVINQFDLSLFDTFEIHIPKEEFKRIFGTEKRPSKEDFLWFCELNRMYQVDHAQPFRSFNNASVYYKVMLKKYTQKANVMGVNKTITDKVKELTRNSTIDELFGIENTDDKKAVANKQQFTPLTRDPIRMEVIAKIDKGLIENSVNIISKTHYDLSLISGGSDAVLYKNIKNHYLVSDNLSLTSWFNINNYTVNDNYNFFNYYDSINSLGIDVSLMGDVVNIKLNADIYNFNLGTVPGAIQLNESVWYSFILNVDQRQRKMSIYIYKRNVDKEKDASFLRNTILKQVHKIELDIVPVEFELENITAKILGSDMLYTNIRLFTDIIPESEHNKILNQSIIRDDSKYLVFADNANNKLVLPSFLVGQVASGPENPFGNG